MRHAKDEIHHGIIISSSICMSAIAVTTSPLWKHGRSIGDTVAYGRVKVL